MNNPYNYHLPVQRDAMFFGRSDLIQALTDKLTQPLPISAALFGGRRSGKTSLLRKLERDMRAQRLYTGPRQLIPWYYDPQAGYPIASGDDFFLLALEMLRQSLDAGGISHTARSSEQLETAYQARRQMGPSHAFEAAFRLLTDQAARPIRFVLLIDEAETLLTAPWGSNLRPNLRYLLSNSGITDSLALMMSGSTRFHAQIVEKDSPLENILTRCTLANLGREESLALAREPNDNQLSLEAAEEVWRQTGGHPCLIQFILHELWEDLDRCTIEDVQEVAAEFGDQVDHFDRWRDAIGEVGLRVYRWLYRQSETMRYANLRTEFTDIDGSDLQRTLDMLAYHGLIHISGHGRRAEYSIAGIMFRDWYRADHPSGLFSQVIHSPVTRRTAPPAPDVFELEIEARGSARYQAQVINAPTGPLRGLETQIDPTAQPLAEMLQRIQIGDVDAALLTEVGRQLFAFLLAGPVQTAYVASREAARARERNLCLKLRLHPPEPGSPDLGILPWELIFDPQDKNFIALSGRTPLVRALPRPIASSLSAVSESHTLLLATASPTDLPPLAIDQEREAILNAVQPLVHSHRLHIIHLDHATPAALIDALRQGVHWLHFVGHGDYDPLTGGGALILEQADSSSARIDVDTLRQLLPEIAETSAHLRLVFLNACATAQVGLIPGTRGLAQTLAQAGIPSTIGMSRPISDRSARAFSWGFYEALAEGWSIEAAVVEGRRRTMLESGLHSGDWAVPILFG
ncbi:MAG: CHAT domain-containing protein [Anaerolineae bacterium]|nr:CHAT domain-containing protein [Anaerolineae bacterium]